MSSVAYKSSLVEFSPKELSVLTLLVNFWANLMIADVLKETNPGMAAKLAKNCTELYDGFTSDLLYDAFSPQDMLLLTQKVKDAFEANMKLNPSLGKVVEAAKKARDAGVPFDFGPDDIPKL